MWRYLLLILTSFSALAENHALLIGVDDYDQLQRLPGAEQDLKRMTEVCQILGYKVKTLPGKKATRKAILAEIEAWLIRGITSRDQVILYFSGHGGIIADDGKDELDGFDEFIAPVETKAELLEGVIRDDELAKLLARCPAARVVVLLDACSSGSGTRGLDLSKSLPDSKDTRSVVPNPNYDEAENLADALPRGNYVALGAANDGSDANSSRAGSLFTLGLYDAIRKIPREQLTPRKLQTFINAYVGKNLKPNQNPQQAVLDGDPILFDRELFPRRPPPTSSQDELQSVAAQAHQGLRASANKQHFQLGETLQLQVDIPSEGYLNILSVDANNQSTVLFPNRWHPDNHVAPGRMSLPQACDRFQLPASEPRGRTRVLLILTQARLDFNNDFAGSDDYLRTLLPEGFKKAIHVMRGFTVTPKEFMAITLDLEIR